MSLDDAMLLTFGFNLLEQDGGGLDEGWEEAEAEDELEGFEVEDEDGVLVDEYDDTAEDTHFDFGDEEEDTEYDQYFDGYLEYDDGPESTSEADPE